MPDVLNVPSGPGGHRPHRDYDDTRAYCAECLEQWPCTAHQASAACAHCGLLFLGADRPEFYDRQGRAFCSWNCAYPPRRFSRMRSWLVRAAGRVGAAFSSREVGR